MLKQGKPNLKCLIDVSVALHLQLNVVKVFFSARLIGHPLASNVGEHFAPEKTRYGLLHRGSLHFALHVVQEDTAQLLGIVLHEGVEGLPTEAACQAFRVDGSLVELQLIEEPLKGQRDAGAGVITLGGHEEDGASKLVREE